MKKRVSKFELLRIIAMYLIVLHHSIVHGVLNVEINSELKYPSATILATILGTGGENRCLRICPNNWIFYDKF